MDGAEDPRAHQETQDLTGVMRPMVLLFLWTFIYKL